MIILALDTSSKAASCALLKNGELLGEYYTNSGLTHSQTIMPMVESLLSTAGEKVAEVDLFAVSNGPGSFTGLRIGLSAVKGMAMATGAPCVPVSTLWALALNLSCFRGYIVPVMDARRSQVYTALFQGDGEQVARKSDDTALSVAGLGEQLSGLEGPIVLVGDGAALCYGQLATLLPGLCMPPPTLIHQRASSVALAAHIAGEIARCSAAELEPRYLRLPQAERERMERLQQLQQRGEQE